MLETYLTVDVKVLKQSSLFGHKLAKGDNSEKGKHFSTNKFGKMILKLFKTVKEM